MPKYTKTFIAGVAIGTLASAAAIATFFWRFTVKTAIHLFEIHNKIKDKEKQVEDLIQEENSEVQN